MEPSCEAVNLTPSCTGLPSVASDTPDGARSGQMAQGHLPPESNALLVMNVYVYGASIVWPELSRAPLIVAVGGGAGGREMGRAGGATRSGLAHAGIPRARAPFGSLHVDPPPLAHPRAAYAP